MNVEDAGRRGHPRLPRFRPAATLALLAILAVAGCSCGPGPSAPSRTAYVGGNWSGTLAYTQTSRVSLLPGYMSGVPTAFVLSQMDSTVTGTWSTQNWGGTISGATTRSDFVGAATFAAPSSSGGTCSGTFAVVGSAGGTTLTWTSPAVEGNCPDMPSNLTFTMRR